MCGICGIVGGHRSSSPDAALIACMCDTMIHRGPDGVGSHIGPGVALGHRRLSIVDLLNGHQPMSSVDGRYVITYNGEIFNHTVLKEEFEANGSPYRTRSDTETVLKMFEKFGDDSVKHLRGMFAFAVWDVPRRRLFLARDRYGVKPLYYSHRSDGSLIFGSEIKAILAALTDRPALNYAALPDFLANHAPCDDQTLFHGIKRVPPGHTLSWHDGRIVLTRYWDLPHGDETIQPGTGSVPERELVDGYLQRFTEAVRLHLMSDVPVGVFLSGGIDSAAITATMAKIVSGPVCTFSVAFAEREANEFGYARMVAEACRSKHREVLVTPHEFFAALPRLVWHEDEPIAHPSSIALYFLSRLASRDVKVVLTGEGSDELLAGYNRYRVTEYNFQLGAAYDRCIPGCVRRGTRRALNALPLKSRLRQIASRSFLMRSANIDDLYFDNFAVFSRPLQNRLLSVDTKARVAGIDPYEAYHAALNRVSGKPLLSRLLYADVGTYLHELLMKQDQMSMAASIESRVPFLDHPLTEWVAGLPRGVKLRGLTTKWILREAMKGKLPSAVLNRKKMGFPVPVGRWLRGDWRPLVDEYVTGDRTRARGIFDPAAVSVLVAEHFSGVNHSERLWALLTFEVWARIFLDGDAPWSMADSSKARMQGAQSHECAA